MPNLPESYQSTSPATDNNSISVYGGELTARCITYNVKKISYAFNLPAGFYDVLSDRIKSNGFDDKRLEDAVNHVIDNCKYPTPTISDFISFDKRVSIYSYNDIVKLSNEFGANVWKQYRAVNINGVKRVVYVNIDEAEIKGLEYSEVPIK